jgi:hypothetical protein
VNETLESLALHEALIATSQLCKYIAEQANDGRDYYNLVGTNDAVMSLLAYFEMRIRFMNDGFQVHHKGMALQNGDGTVFECEVWWDAVARAVETIIGLTDHV